MPNFGWEADKSEANCQCRFPVDAENAKFDALSPKAIALSDAIRLLIMLRSIK
jgi:hypothetical protein